MYNSSANIPLNNHTFVKQIPLRNQDNNLLAKIKQWTEDRTDQNIMPYN